MNVTNTLHHYQYPHTTILVYQMEKNVPVWLVRAIVDDSVKRSGHSVGGDPANYSWFLKIWVVLSPVTLASDSTVLRWLSEKSLLFDISMETIGPHTLNLSQ
ncbi:hypothetical protein [Yoonia sp. 2307UL14-13]|uniref:hypothetical protein n=1 Tax=Yoonia sp. 2307UL14-13 TaxID=3126506 RepID=UPI0030B0BF1F